MVTKVKSSVKNGGVCVCESERYFCFVMRASHVWMRTNFLRFLFVEGVLVNL